MTKWEYRVEDISYMGRAGRESTLDEMGEEGWELVGVDNGGAYFKRPKVEADDAESRPDYDPGQ